MSASQAWANPVSYRHCSKAQSETSLFIEVSPFTPTSERSPYLLRARCWLVSKPRAVPPSLFWITALPTRTTLLATQASATPHICLITVEYDIREDKPEVTTVVRILAEKPDIAETLILRRHPGLGQVNSRVIAEFSGGNARLALTLADAVSDQESLSDFSDAQIFGRLFFQRGAPDEQLLAAAEILSLVYSYSLETDEGGVDELATLAAMADLPRLTLYRATQTLVDRQLVQKRGRWRAVLPPAVSNGLAARALLNFPVEHIQIELESLPDRRLLKSFGRRLGYLHDHDMAQSIVQTWLSPGGRLHDIDCLDDDDIQLLANVAPVAPEAVLEAVETRSRQTEYDYFFTDRNLRALDIAELLHAIAYDSVLFEKSVPLLAQFALAETQSQQSQSDMRRRLCSLFWMCLSGTEAGPDVRERMARRFLFSEDPADRQLGLGMLDAALQSGQWLSFRTFDFGARLRSFGYQPRTLDELNRWFQRFLSLAHEVATGTKELCDPTRNLLGEQFRSLWRLDGLRLELAAIAKSLNEQRPWPAGWKAVRSIKHHDRRAMQQPDMAHALDLLNELDELLKPRDLVDQIRTYVLTPAHKQIPLNDEFDFEDEERFSASRERAAARAFDLGETVAGDPDVISDLCEDLFRTLGGYLPEFGRGMASSCPDPHELWTCAVAHLERAGDSARHCGLLEGILKVIHQRDPSLAEQLLDEAVQRRSLRNFFVWLQLSTPLNRRAVQRLLDCLDFDDTPIFQFGQIAQHHQPNVLDETDIAQMFLKVLDRPDGAEFVLDGLNVRLPVFETDHGISLGEELSRVGLLAASRYLRGYNGLRGASTDNSIRRVLASCMNHTSLAREIDDLFEAFFVAVKTSTAISATWRRQPKF